ncbi:nucleotidyltransferase family protein [Formosa sediminum]|uniref:Nucleotidyltransferase family protein n=1 Tax=Formosa sediminum TaxID=2594004 RepID=A0A516GQ96_9FLAO|nr:nucleotidyltransferase family protein [Formosa sediminum]QDO93663.1 nucleotidyltransferase family protein [Formosa sediminum]
MNTTHTTLSHISHIISFKTDASFLKADIKNYNWENIVKMGSEHLIIPTIYARLKSKGLLKYLPQDLHDYLKYIYNLNEERNKFLLEEVKLINSWFNANNIEHVFLKGAAMIASNYYELLGERMLGDIDVLVPKELSEKAFQILINKGYTYAKTPTINPKYFEDKHLLRLASKNYIGAVEVHFKLLDKDQAILKPEHVLNNKQFVNHTHLPIPSPKHLITHNVLNFQINDLGSYYNYIGLKNCYDTLVLLPRINDITLTQVLQNRHISNNFNLGHLYFSEIPEPTNTLRIKYNTSIYHLKNKYNSFNFLLYKIHAYLDLLKLLFNRTYFFIKNKDYRRDILNDRSRIKALIKSKL